MAIGKRGDKLTNQHAEWHKRQARWKHNSFLGHARMMQMQCKAILMSATATDEAKAIAVRIEQEAEMLADALRNRKQLL